MRCCGLRRARPVIWSVGLDAHNFIDADFHAQRAGLDFRGRTFYTAQHYGFAESANLQTSARQQTGRRYGSYFAGGGAEVGLRFGDGLHYGKR